MLGNGTLKTPAGDNRITEEPISVMCAVSRNAKIKIQKKILVLPVFYVGVKFGLRHQGKNICRWRLKNWALRNKIRPKREKVTGGWK